MKPQSAAFLEKSREFLAKAQNLLDVHHWPDDTGRAAYLAGLHAAQALIFEHSGKAIKRHSGVQREFARLVKDDPRLDMELRAFLPRAYNLKAIADYETGPGSQVSAERAREAIQAASRYVECVAGLLPMNGRNHARRSRTKALTGPACRPAVRFPTVPHSRNTQSFRAARATA